jgi:hypothetical protein
MSNRASPSQKVVRYVPFAGAVAGMFVILGSIAYFFPRDQWQILGAAVGILALLGAVWYAAHPFFKSTRRYLLLRGEVAGFIKLVSALNDAVVNGASTDEIEQARARLYASVDRIVAAAGRTQ